MRGNYSTPELSEQLQRISAVDILLKALKLQLADGGPLSDPISRKSAHDTALAAIEMVEAWQRSVRFGGSKKDG